MLNNVQLTSRYASPQIGSSVCLPLFQLICLFLFSEKREALQHSPHEDGILVPDREESLYTNFTPKDAEPLFTELKQPERQYIALQTIPLFLRNLHNPAGLISLAALPDILLRKQHKGAIIK